MILFVRFQTQIRENDSNQVMMAVIIIIIIYPLTARPALTSDVSVCWAVSKNVSW